MVAILALKMQEPEATVEAPPGPAVRRGKRLPPIQTNFAPDLLPNIQRPPPIETIIYKTSPEQPLPSLPSADSTAIGKRASRSILSGLFNRSRSVKEQLSPVSSHDNTEHDIVQGRSDSPSSGMPRPRSSDNKVRKPPPPKKIQPQRSVMTWDPLPLFQAYTQAAKYADLVVPATSADLILKSQRQSQTRRKSETHIAEEDETTRLESGPVETRRKSNKSATSSVNLEWVAKIFVLTTTGFLLQYAGSGHHDRLPEKIIQLTKDSAAFASDAIPGKHWVLQVTQAFSDDENYAPASSKSVFSKLGRRTEPKRVTKNFLLVMESAQDMDAWLVSVRKQIQALGGKTYRPDEVSRKSPIDIMQQLQQKPSRRFLIERNPPPDGGEHSPTSIRKQSEGSILSTTFEHGTASDVLLPRLGVVHQEGSISRIPQNTIKPNDLDTSTTSKPTIPKISFQPVQYRDTPPASPPPAGQPPDSLLRWELPANFTPSFSTTTAGFMSTSEHNSGGLQSAKSDYTRRESLLSGDRRSSQSSQPRGYRSASVTSDQAPNFSLPTFSHRFSQSTRSGTTIITPPTSSGSARRPPSPSSSESSHKRTDSILPELPVIVLPSSSKNSIDGSVPQLIFSDGVEEWEDPEEPESIQGHPQDSTIPKRLSSLGNLLDDLEDTEDSVPSDASASNGPIPKRLSSLGNLPRFSHPAGSGVTNVVPSQSQLQPDVVSPRRHSAMDFVPKGSTPKRNDRLSYLPPQLPPPTGALPAVPTNQKPLSIPMANVAAPKVRRPASLQVKSNSGRLTERASFNNLQTSSPAVMPMTIRERRSFMGRPPSHLLGPPKLPPPNAPLPSVPQAQAENANCAPISSSTRPLELVRA